MNKKIQNSGVSVVTEGGVVYYGILTDIIELNYSNKKNMCYSNVNGSTFIVGEGTRLMR